MLSQYLANGLQAGSITALVGTGFFIVYRTSRFFNFAHGIVITFAAYCVFFFMKSPIGLPIICISIAVILVFFMGLSKEAFVFLPLRRRHSNGTALLIAALGIYILVQNVISIVFGDDTRSFRWWPVEEGWLILGARITTTQIIIVICSWAILISSWAFLKYSMLGKRIEAVASDPELALIVGINVERTYLWAMGLGAILGGSAGILAACDVDIAGPTMGMQLLMMGVVAAIIGGNNIYGAALGAVILGMAKHVGVIWIPTMWQEAITFVILLTFLFIKPYGFSK